MSTKNRVVKWKCSAGHEVDLVLGPNEEPTPERLQEIRLSFANGCTRKLKTGICGAVVKEIANG